MAVLYNACLEIEAGVASRQNTDLTGATVKC